MKRDRTETDHPRRRPAILLLLAVLILGGFIAGCGDDDGGESGSTGTEEEAQGGQLPGEEVSGDCAEVASPSSKSVDIKAPGAKQPVGSTVVFATNCGSFTVTLDSERAPKTAASFEYLAEEGVFDGTPFHRIAPGFVIQGGDPSGNGTGGPGYSVTERPPGDLSYSRGLVAMAKTGAEPPGTSGSQFFVVTAPADAGLPPEYALVGEVTEGFETVLAIEALGVPGSDGPPTQPVVIESATVEG